MADWNWDDLIILNGWPECGPGRLRLEDLYQVFKERFEREQELKRHEPGCWLHADGEKCTCSAPQHTGDDNAR
jgi:hypothetical protein